MADVISDGGELSNDQAMTHLLESMRAEKLDVKHENKVVSLGDKLGSGGSKTVYDAVVDGEPFALALPNTTDDVQKMRQKWQNVLKEPDNTEKVRGLGLYTNPTCEVVPTSINGVIFPALKMARYQDLPFPIVDSKNVTSSTVNGNLLPGTLTIDAYQELMASILPDLEIMIKNGVQVGSDSINICLIEGKPRIYLNDLGTAVFKPFQDDQIPQVAEMYISNANGAFLNGLTEPEYQKHNTFFNGDAFKFNNPQNITKVLSQKLIERVTA